MVSMLVTVDRVGRLVIPKDVRDQLELEPGIELELSVEGDSLRFTPRRAPGRRIVEIDGWPVIEAVRGVSITDADVQRWRDDVQR